MPACAGSSGICDSRTGRAGAVQQPAAAPRHRDARGPPMVESQVPHLLRNEEYPARASAAANSRGARTRTQARRPATSAARAKTLRIPCSCKLNRQMNEGGAGSWTWSGRAQGAMGQVARCSHWASLGPPLNQLKRRHGCQSRQQRPPHVGLWQSIACARRSMRSQGVSQVGYAGSPATAACAARAAADRPCRRRRERVPSHFSQPHCGWLHLCEGCPPESVCEPSHTAL